MDPVAYWTDYLDLDASQQTSVKTILADQQSSSNSLKNLDGSNRSDNQAKRPDYEDSVVKVFYIPNVAAQAERALARDSSFEGGVLHPGACELAGAGLLG
jgi:hypothetical protein